MPSATKRIPRRKPGPRATPWWQTLGPLLLATVLTPIAVRAASILALSGPSGLRLLYPWVLLLETPILRLPAPRVESISEWTMWLMLPVYALIIIVMKRTSTLMSGIILVLLVHGLAVLAAVATG